MAQVAELEKKHCGVCGRTLGVGYYYCCHVCGRAFCYTHAPQKCGHLGTFRSSPPAIPSPIRNVDNKAFCTKCGFHQEGDTKYCRNCNALGTLVAI